VTKANTRDLLWPLLARIGERFERGAHAVACGFGAKAVEKLGKGARVLPPRRTVVSALRGTGLWLLVGADRVDRIGRPPPEPEEEKEPDSLADETEEVRPRPLLGPEPAATTRITALRPVRPAHPVRAPEPAAEPEPEPPPPEEPAPAANADDPLFAIRAMMRAAAAPPPVPKKPLAAMAAPPEPDPVTGLAALPPLAPPEPPTPGPNLRMFGAATGLAVFGLSLPLGALLAGISYLRGEDLRLRETA
jgi:hypothetical protein